MTAAAPPRVATPGPANSNWWRSVGNHRSLAGVCAGDGEDVAWSRGWTRWCPSRSPTRCRQDVPAPSTEHHEGEAAGDDLGPDVGPEESGTGKAAILQRPLGAARENGPGGLSPTSGVLQTGREVSGASSPGAGGKPSISFVEEDSLCWRRTSGSFQRCIRRPGCSCRLRRTCCSPAV